MNITIDIRSLLSGTVTGVEGYVLNLTEALLEHDRQNRYRLYVNSRRNPHLPRLRSLNAKTVRSRWPNPLLNLALAANLTTVEKLAGETDILFLPNLLPFSANRETKVVVTLHDCSPVTVPENYNLKRRVWHRLLNYKKSLDRADLVLAVSEYTAHDAERLFGIPKEKIQVVYPGSDHVHPAQVSAAAMRDARNRFYLPGDFVLFLNTLEPRKNLLELVRALELLPPEVDLVVVGRLGWKYANLLREIDRSPARRRIHLLGYVKNPVDLAAIVKLARCAVYPSTYEGFGFQPLEAALLGTPSVISHVTALPEVSGSFSLSADPYNPESLARAIRSLLTDAPLRDRLAARAAEALPRFTWARAAEQVLRAFSTLRP